MQQKSSEIQKAATSKASAQTVRWRLWEHGLKARKPASKPRLTQEHKKTRMLWAVAHHRWTCEQWSRVLFTDEASFSVTNKDGRFYCYRRQNEHYVVGNIREHMNRGYGCVSIWGAIVHDRKLPLVRIDGRLNAQRYIDDILTQHVIPYMRYERANGRVLPLQQDRVPPQTANTTKEYLEQSNVNVLDWPAISPDMNCIENLWSVLSRALRTHTPQPQNNELFFKSFLQHGIWYIMMSYLLIRHKWDAEWTSFGMYREDTRIIDMYAIRLCYCQCQYHSIIVLLL